MGTARTIIARHKRRAEWEDRLRLLYPTNASGTPIYVHAKSMIVDGRFLRVDSSNLSNRSMGLEIKCNIAVEIKLGAQNEEALRTADRRPERPSRRIFEGSDQDCGRLAGRRTKPGPDHRPPVEIYRKDASSTPTTGPQSGRRESHRNPFLDPGKPWSLRDKLRQLMPRSTLSAGSKGD